MRLRSLVLPGVILVSLALIAPAGSATVVPVDVGVSAELEDPYIEPGETAVTSVSVTNRGDTTKDFDVDLSIGGTSYDRTVLTLDPDETETVQLTAVLEAEGAYSVVVEADGGGGVRQSVSQTLVVGDPAVEMLSLDAPDQHVANEPLPITGRVTYADGPSRTVRNLTATVHGDEIAVVDGKLDMPPGSGEVTVAAQYGSASANKTIVVIDPADLAVVPTRVHVGQDTRLETVLAVGEGRSVTITDTRYWDRSADEASMRPDRIQPTEPGEITVKVFLEGTSVELNVTILKQPEGIELEGLESPLSIGERSFVGVEAIYQNETVEEVTFQADIRIENRSVIGVEEGQLVGLAAGETVVTATYGGLKTNATVAVEPPSDGLAGPAPLVVAAAVLVMAVVMGWRRAQDYEEISDRSESRHDTEDEL